MAYQALEANPDIGLLLPCNVVVWQEDKGSVAAAFVYPAAVLGLVDKPGVEALAIEVRGKLERVRDALRETRPA